MKRWVMLAALLMLAVPAGALPGHHVIQYTQQVVGATTSNGVVAEATVEVARPHTWVNHTGTSRLEVLADYAVAGAAVGTQRADFRVVWDGVPLTECFWSIRGAGDAVDRQTIHVGLSCVLDFVEPGNHTVEVRQTLLQGNPILHGSISILLHQQETVLMDIDVNLTPEIFAHLAWVVWAAYFALTNVFKHPGMRFLAAFVGYAILALPIQEVQFIWMFIGQTMTVAYQAFRYFTKLE